MTIMYRLMEPIIKRIVISIGEYIAENVCDGWRKFHARNRPRIRGVKNLHPMPFYKKTPYEQWGFGKDTDIQEGNV